MFHEPEDAYRAALAMVNLFASVGADRFDVTLTSLQGRKIRFRPNLDLQDVRCRIPKSLDSAGECQHNIIVRPRVSDKRAFLVQLDDVNEATLGRLEQAAFMTIETSPGNFQGWVAIAFDTGIHEKDISSALRKGTGADTTASGATRLAGSRNFKEKYAPDYPYVTITQSRPGLVITTAQLEEQGLLSIPLRPVSKPIPRFAEWTHARKPKRFPDYERCLRDAPPNSRGDAQDTSRADFTWCIIAIDWGWTIEETAAQLLKERVDDKKRHRNGYKYAELTATEAAKAVENNRARRW